MTRNQLTNDIATFIMRGQKFHYLIKDELPSLSVRVHIHNVKRTP